jgi:O-antigen ligase
MSKQPLVETLLRRTALSLTLILPCLFGFLTTYVLLLLLLVVTVYLFFHPSERALRLDRAGKLFLAGYLILAAGIAIDAATAGQPHDLLYALDFGMLLLYAPLASLYDRAAAPRNAAVASDLALAGVAIAFLLGIVEELLLHPDRAGYLRSDPIRYADTALILGFLALMGLVAHRGRRRWLYLAGPLLGLASTLMSGSRSALLAFPLMAIVAVAMLIRRRGLAWIIGIGAIIVVGAGFAIGVGLGHSRSLGVFGVVRTVLAGGTVADSPTRERIAIYRAGWQAFLQSPVFGVGWHRKMDVIAQYLAPADRNLANLPHLHDEVLNFGVGNGIFGIIAYLLLISLPIVVCLRSPRDSQYRVRLYGCALLVGSYVTLGLADVMIGFELHTALYVALTALLLSYCRDRPAQGQAVAA